MTRRERDEVMRYVGLLEGLSFVLMPMDDGEDDCEFLRQKILDIASDLEALAKGADGFDSVKGGGEDDE